MDSNMETTAEPQSHKRLIIVTWCALGWGLVMFSRLVQLQVLEHDELAQRAKRQQVKRTTVTALRGQILTRDGGHLAMSVPVDAISINPMQIPDVDFATSMLAPTLDLDAKKLETAIMEARTARRGYLRIKDDATMAQVDTLRGFKLDYVTVEAVGKRVYPKQMLAANVVGSVNSEGRGEGGLEFGLEDDLAGLDGELMVDRDSRSRGYNRRYDCKPKGDEATGEDAPKRAMNSNCEPSAGQNITLTLDEGIQFAAEKYLREAMEREKIPFGSVVVLHVKTGDVLAMASWPTFDPNIRLQDKSEMSHRLNYAMTVPFEPGSVCKVVTMTAALETTNLRSETPITCGGTVMRVLGRDIHDEHAYGTLPMRMVLAKSSNLGSVRIGMQVGKENLYKYMKLFGFGDTVGLSVPGESGGVLRPTRQWNPDSIASIAIGHEMMTTTMQLAQAASIIANNGVLIPPRLILQKQEPGRAPEKEPVGVGERRIKAETAITMRRMMESVVLEGTGKPAKLKGYTSGGKTGTGKIWEQGKGYRSLYNSTYMGFAPLSNPEIVVVVTLNRTSKKAGGIAGPIFRDIAQNALRILGVPKDVPESEVTNPSTTPPVLDEEEEEEEERTISVAKAEPNVVSGPTAPNFKGMTLRAVLQKSAAEGLQVDVVGSGIAKRQQPEAGTSLDRARRIRVVFSR
jgi:cell division protein FtsI (penicillin-binding protein 3)